MARPSRPCPPFRAAAAGHVDELAARVSRARAAEITAHATPFCARRTALLFSSAGCSLRTASRMQQGCTQHVRTEMRKTAFHELCWPLFVSANCQLKGATWKRFVTQLSLIAKRYRVRNTLSLYLHSLFWAASMKTTLRHKGHSPPCHKRLRR